MLSSMRTAVALVFVALAAVPCVSAQGSKEHCSQYYFVDIIDECLMLQVWFLSIVTGVQ